MSSSRNWRGSQSKNWRRVQRQTKMPEAESRRPSVGNRKPEADLEAKRQIRHAATAARVQMGNLAHVALCMPLRANLLGICHGSRGALRSGARLMDGWCKDPPLSSLRGQRLRSGGEALSRLRKIVICNWARKNFVSKQNSHQRMSTQDSYQGMPSGIPQEAHYK